LIRIIFIPAHVGDHEVVRKEGSTDRKHGVIIRQWKIQDSMAALYNNCSVWTETALVPRVKTMHVGLKRCLTTEQVFFKVVERAEVFFLG
jgi:hypothetical protein